MPDEHHIAIYGKVYWGDTPECEELIIPIMWFALPEEELEVEIKKWISDYWEKIRKQNEEAERKKAEDERQKELAELARLQAKYGKLDQ